MVSFPLSRPVFPLNLGEEVAIGRYCVARKAVLFFFCALHTFRLAAQD
jgi:hypothetical protein